MGRRVAKKVPATPVHTGLVAAVWDTDCDCWLYYESVDDIPDQFANQEVRVFVLEDIKTLRIGRHLE